MAEQSQVPVHVNSLRAILEAVRRMEDAVATRRYGSRRIAKENCAAIRDILLRYIQPDIFDVAG